ncbi:class II fructose-bisphosphate aldolase [Aspergillus lucknowensis]|uniref:Fructose-bisphosphate aldolase n=1 Tax=Aspergillus lucknowensis TaxID=176173 RepID=A0ABR4L8L2_9EURO
MAEVQLQNNITRSILHAAKAKQYAVGAYNCYNTDGIMAVIRAAEAKKSPAVIQLFPWTLHFQGPEFVRYVERAAHAAPVPIAVHLDHCINPADIALALTMPFDSIMIDGSTLDESANVEICAGSEDVYGDFLAPSFGNIHGGYGPSGPEKSWNTDLLSKIASTIEQPLVLHGTHPVSDQHFRKAIDCGVAKINVNRAVRDEYTKFVAENAGKLELTVLKVQAVDIYTKSI